MSNCEVSSATAFCEIYGCDNKPAHWAKKCSFGCGKRLCRNHTKQITIGVFRGKNGKDIAKKKICCRIANGDLDEETLDKYKGDDNISKCESRYNKAV